MLETLARDCSQSRFWWVTDSCLTHGKVGGKPILAVRCGDGYCPCHHHQSIASVLQSYTNTSLLLLALFSVGNKPITLQSHV